MADLSTRAELERRREELAAQVAELHWDLGGLAYEMAIRDHFRNDVLMRRAALLQERDAELAEVERKLGYVRAQGGEPGDQQQQARRAWAHVLPPAQMCALLLVVFLGFGAAVGAAAKSSRAPRPRARVVLVAQAPSVSSPSPPIASSAPTPSPSSSSSSSEGGSATEGAGKGASSSSTTHTTLTGGKTGKTKSDSSGGASGGGGSSSPSSSPSGSSHASRLPPVKHVFVVMLDDEPYATAFGPASPAHYLTGTLEHKGELLVRYYAVAHEQLANGIALISGQGPTVQTAQNCPMYEDVVPGTAGAEGQVSGQGGVDQIGRGSCRG